MRHLQSPAEFRAVLESRPVGRSAHFALHRRALPSGPGQHIGAVVPKRWAKRAVTRNLIKRQIYAMFFQHQSELPGMAFVVRLRGPFAAGAFPSARSRALALAVRAELRDLLAAGNAG